MKRKLSAKIRGLKVTTSVGMFNWTTVVPVLAEDGLVRYWHLNQLLSYIIIMKYERMWQAQITGIGGRVAERGACPNFAPAEHGTGHYSIRESYGKKGLSKKYNRIKFKRMGYNWSMIISWQVELLFWIHIYSVWRKWIPFSSYF